MSVCSQTGVWEQENFPPRSQTEVWERNDPGNSVSSNNTNELHLYPKQSFECQCVPKPEFGNKKQYPKQSFRCQCVPKPEFGNKKKLSHWVRVKIFRGT